MKLTFDFLLIIGNDIVKLNISLNENEYNLFNMVKYGEYLKTVIIFFYHSVYV